MSAARGGSIRTYLDADLDDAFDGRAALLSPLDRLVMDRKRQEEILEFDYQLEMYKPAAKRRWGYWAMPILYDDALVGKLDATADRDARRAPRRRRPRGRRLDEEDARRRRPRDRRPRGLARAGRGALVARTLVEITDDRSRASAATLGPWT